MKNFLINDKEMQGRDWLVDAGVALGAFAFGCLQLVLSSSSIIIADETFRQMIGVINASPTPAAYIAMAITTVPLLLRRQYSWPVFIFVTLAFLIMQEAFRGFSFVIIGPAVALYSIARERGRNEALVATLLGVLALFFVAFTPVNASMALFLRVQSASYLVVAALAGFAVRTYREYVAEVEQRALAAEKSREEEAARRVEEERVHIAREIHDITAHSLSAVSIQAAAAERLMSNDPEAAQKAIKSIRATSKDALEEIRAMIGVLRQGDGLAEASPTSGTERMGDLVSYLEGAGIQVDFSERAYDREQTPSFIDIALFGIAREAVTNVVRHAQASRVNIELKTEEGHACLVVEDNGIGLKKISATEGDSRSGRRASDAEQESCHDQPGELRSDQGGHGIQGMRERVYVLGGTLEACDRVGGGFLIRAAIPLSSAGRVEPMKKDAIKDETVKSEAAKNSEGRRE